MKQNQEGGFTLIELVVVIVILGILAAVALPRFVNLGADASAAATSGVAGALASAASINYAAMQVNTSRGVTVNNCSHVVNALQGGLPAGYTLTTIAATVSAGATQACTVTGPNSATANFTAIGA